MTSCPSCNKRSHKCDPRKPAPPVTKVRMIKFQKSSFLFAPSTSDNTAESPQQSSSWDGSQHTDEETAMAPHMIEPRDYTKWELVDQLGNKFNRLVMYRSDNYHVSMDYFGKDLYTGRLYI